MKSIHIASYDNQVFPKINFFMCKNKGKFIVFEKLDCQLDKIVVTIVTCKIGNSRSR
jgi:hypothetical protein